MSMNIPPAIGRFLDKQGVMTVAAATPDGHPRASSFLFVHDGPCLYFWARPETLTARLVEQNPAVAFAIDDFDGNLGNVQGLQGIGTCKVITDGRRIAEVAALFGAKFPELAPGATMSISFFEIDCESLDLIDNTRSGSAPAAGTFGASFNRVNLD
jgi:uncharacterized protein YhbP (UPF0306 family)